ncbi:MAG: glycine cleavage system aminomethyltransferase GcvT [Zhongshania sp.]|uniref:glycine cleavage system aminomethyltransferase GcvT n=1 Tax=Zhongshania sp. TaxID=1971902 RepID=UPI00260B9D05|nr:glycine cleavage system aminomethyltransferase GcvT [Zhongshania sp.]MDF1691655.1 glycine cleavage system aminomethyltransferase GcvT [Zhongshania sp.]
MTTEVLKTTALNALHRELGAKMVPFAGYDMPVQYPLGVMKEHLHVREAAGLFDVSHMGQIRLRGENIAQALEALMPQDVMGLPVDRQRYGLLTNEQGGIRDDLMFANCGDSFMLVVNAACKDQDYLWLRQNLPESISMEMLNDQGLLALQGPAARQVMARLAPETETMVFMDTRSCQIAGMDCWLSCSGYTGEDGFEISVAAADTEALARLLLAQDEVEFIGLGARDSLRLEAGLCLYGHDMDETISPISANLLWAISKVRRPGEARAGNYPGAAVIAQQLAEGTDQKRVLLDVEGRAPVREGAEIVTADGSVVGRVSSGGFGPSIARPLVMAYVANTVLSAGDALFASVRGKLLPVALRQAPFVAQRYYRG